jgi:uncharacterized membrane-anchored protein
MITLTILIAIWGIFSMYKIYQHNRKRGTPFDIYDSSVRYHVGAIVFIAMALYIFIYMCVVFLP